jgi:hypothetical protein
MNVEGRGQKKRLPAEREDVRRRRGNRPRTHEHEVGWRKRRAEKDRTEARDIKRESLDVINRENEM